MSNFFQRGCDIFCCLGRNNKPIESKIIQIKEEDLQLKPEELTTKPKKEKAKKPSKTTNLESTDADSNEKAAAPKKKRISRPWTKEDDQLLKKLHKQFGGKWSEIVAYFPNRTVNQCSQRWKKIKPNKTRKLWLPEEDKMLLELYEKYGQNWQVIAFHLNERTGKQVRDRYINILDPGINHLPWTEWEDEVLLKEYYKIGGKWSIISKELDGRPENMVKNRFYSCLKKKIGSEKSVLDVTNVSKVNEPGEFMEEREMNEDDSEIKEEFVEDYGTEIESYETNPNQDPRACSMMYLENLTYQELLAIAQKQQILQNKFLENNDNFVNNNTSYFEKNVDRNLNRKSLLISEDDSGGENKFPNDLPYYNDILNNSFQNNKRNSDFGMEIEIKNYEDFLMKNNTECTKMEEYLVLKNNNEIKMETEK